MNGAALAVIIAVTVSYLAVLIAVVKGQGARISDLAGEVRALHAAMCEQVRR